MYTRNYSRIWGKPLMLAILIIFGLLAALLGTGVWHLCSWITLCVPVLTIIIFTLKPKLERLHKSHCRYSHP